MLTVFSLPLSLGAGPEERRGDDKRDGAHHHKPKDDHQQVLKGCWNASVRWSASWSMSQATSIRTGIRNLITGANLRIVNGLGFTSCVGVPDPNCPNGVGNLIVGYNEARVGEPTVRTGSHNVAVGPFHNFTRFGGIVVGALNEISGDFASVTAGNGNTASGDFAAISGGKNHTASGESSSVSGGNEQRHWRSVFVAAGAGNTASGFTSYIGGGQNNTTSTNASFSSMSGGLRAAMWKERTSFGGSAVCSRTTERLASIRVS